MPKQKDFLLHKKGKDDKVRISFHLLLTPKEIDDLKVYANVIGYTEAEVIEGALSKLLKRDQKFRDLEKSAEYNKILSNIKDQKKPKTK